MRFLTICIALFAFASTLCAQLSGAEQIVAEMLEEMAADENISDDDLETASSTLLSLEEPIDLNAATRDELEQLFFLNSTQIDALLRHREQMSGFVTPQELLLVGGLSRKDVERLLVFTTIGTYDARSNGTLWRHEMVGRWQRTFPKANGYKAKNDSTSPNFLGDPYRLLVRMNGSVGKQIEYGLVMENDAGEPMFDSHATLTDFVSGFVVFTPKKSFVRKAIVGHYSAQVGQGLALWTGFASDASATQSSIDRRARGLNKTMSASESGYLRGAALGLGRKKLRADLFASFVDNDATIYLNDDSTEYFSSFSTDGLHRTQSEQNSRKNLGCTTLGGYFTYHGNALKASAGYNHWHGSKRIQSNGDAYRYHMPSGHNLGTAHADYHLYLPTMVLYGEVVWQTSNTFAGMQAIDINLGGGNLATFGFRKFGKQYFKVNQNPFSTSSNPSGEAGGYASLTLAPLRHLAVRADVNFYRNAWAQYQKPFLTDGMKARAQAAYTISRRSELTLRLRYENRENSSSENSHQLANRKRLSLRLAWDNKPSDILSLRTYVEHVGYGEGNVSDSKGFMMAQQVNIALPRPDLKATFLLTHFDTDDYYSRVYCYQPDVLYSMSIPSYYGNGVGFLTKITWKITPFATLWLWGNYVKYYDRDEISSGNTQLDSSHRFDTKIQLRIKLGKYFRRKAEA